MYPCRSNVNAIPEIIGDSGYIIKKKDINLIKEALQKAFKSDLTLGELAKERIIKNFSFEKREVELYNTLKEYLKK